MTPTTATPPHKVVMLGLDACDPGLAQHFAASGVMPNLSRLLAEGARASVRNPFGLFVGALWVSFGTALRPERHRFHCWDEIDPATYRYRLNAPDIAHLPTFWRTLSAHGRTVAAIDVPHMVAGPLLNGLEVVEWGCHDRHHGFHSAPPELAESLAARFGLHPAFKGGDAFARRDFAPDDFGHRDGWLRTAEEDARLLADFLQGAQQKERLVRALLNEKPWDFFIAVFGESHGAGHQLWHLHDPDHPRHDAATVARIGGDPLAQVYGALDAAVGRIAADLSPETLLLVHLSHGMGPHYDGTHMLEEVLSRLSLTWQAPTAAREEPRGGLVQRLQEVARVVGVPRSIKRKLGEMVFGAERLAAEARAGQPFFSEPNNTVFAGIRLNLAGREPRGWIEPEAVDDVIARLAEDLTQIVNPRTGKPAIRRVLRSDLWHGRRADDTMPDLFVQWDRSAPIDQLSSPKIGLVEAPYHHWRTGDHRPTGLLLARGPTIPAGQRLPRLDVEDIGPSLAAYLGLKLCDVDGVARAWLAPAHMPAGV